jgi:hypothetical protein
MALMQPREFICGVETVRWVYKNTTTGSELRAFIATVFVQRGPPVCKALFSRENERLGFLGDAVGFLRVLNRVRAGNPRGVEGYDLHALFPMVHVYLPGKDAWSPGRVCGSLVTGGRKVEWSKIEYPLPSFLVWGEKWEILPDMHFVTAEHAVEAAKHMTVQVEAAARTSDHKRVVRSHAGLEFYRQ